MDKEDAEALGEGDGREEPAAVVRAGVLADEHGTERHHHAH